MLSHRALELALELLEQLEAVEALDLFVVLHREGADEILVGRAREDLLRGVRLLREIIGAENGENGFSYCSLSFWIYT